MRAEQERRERRRRTITIAVVVGVIVALVGSVTTVLLTQQRERSAVEAAADRPIADVNEAADLPAGHVEASIAPSALPPMGGDHDPVWQNCGIYSEPVPTENAVHSLEHGAVWVAYSPDLPADEVVALTSLVSGKPYALLSPYPDLASPVVLTAWGVQLELDDVTDERLPTFLEKYLQGDQTPEPGASCTGGTGTPA